MSNARIRVAALYLPLVMVALQGWQSHRLYLALDTTMLWERALYDSPVGRLLRTGSPVVVAGGANTAVPVWRGASIKGCYANPVGFCGITRM